ncbi:hypothetical protein JCM9533A_50090 [Catenuloplanes niger JCM 9533]
MWTVAVAVASLIALGGCGGGEDGAAPAAPETPPVVATSSAAAPEPAVEPSFSEQDRAAYLTALAEIDEGLVANEDRAVRRAEETCADIAAGEITGTALADRVVERLSGGNATIDRAQAEQAIELMKKHICK